MEQQLSMGSRLWGCAVSAALLALVITPVAWRTGRDSFPRSSYPMFARKQVAAAVQLDYAFGVDRQGRRVILRPDLVANGEVLQARAALSRAVRSRKRAAELCQHIAAQVVADDGLSSIASVRIVSGRYDAVAFLRGDRTGDERIRAECEVPR